ncbi:MAG: FAD-binding oxidoreductase [Verrucomicrobiae bacterium]|nr:FAD-binding oxidoreductase [Verrucomicrobiae bacterium]
MNHYPTGNYWLDAPRPPPCPKLTGAHTADVVVVGGGFTGLWSALRLRELWPSAGIVVVEQGLVGHGGSGRNAGQVAGSLDHSHREAIAHFGEAEARRMATVGLENLAEFERFLVANAIECEYARNGLLRVALTSAQLDGLLEERAAAETCGVSGLELLDATAVRAELNSPRYLGGLHDPTWGLINPVKLVDGLKQLALTRGVRLFERSPVTQLRVEAGKVRASTAEGDVVADRAVLATDVYSYRLMPRLLRRYVPLYDYVMVTAPLRPEQRAALGWRRRQGVTDERTFFNYYRLTADDRVLWGSSEARYYPGTLVSETHDHSLPHYRQLEESFRWHFPQLGEVRFEYAWGGPIAATTRLTPFFGAEGEGRIVHALGYTGLGIASSHLAGKILAHMIAERPDRLMQLEMVRRRPLPYPPEPLRRWSIEAVTRSLRRVDDGRPPNLLLRLLDALGIGFSS